MKYETILRLHGIIRKAIVHDNLSLLGDDLFGDDWSFRDSIASTTNFGILSNQYDIKIGNEFLKHKCEPNTVNRAGYVIAVEHMYHEHRHTQQYEAWHTITDMISVKSVRQMTDIVRRNFIANFYHSAYTHNYKEDPGEMDAEIYGILSAINYFEHNPIITQKEAKEILFQFMMSEDCGHKEELDRYKPQSINDVIEAFKDLKDTTVHKLYPITLEPSPIFGKSTIPDNDMTEEFLRSGRYRTFRDEMKLCKDGKQLDKLLEQTIVLKYPDIAQYVPRLQNELEACKKQMQERIFLNKHAIPISQINYAGKVEDDFTTAVNELSDSNNNKTL